ncbi:MAG: helix-turn-helix transcriptional regulator [Actinobacteria bacterium]|nr:helix-turn-helix transcriptional regulator [Actinomycetota bacterium]
MVTYPLVVDLVFRALADPTRRALLDALFARDGQSVQALCALVPEMTRFGVMKHLEILEGANLVTTRREGRTKLHFLNPVPIQQVADRWIGKYAQPFTRALVDLQTDLEHRTA